LAKELSFKCSEPEEGSASHGNRKRSVAAQLSRRAHADPTTCPCHASRELGFEARSPDLCSLHRLLPDAFILYLTNLFLEKHKCQDPATVGPALAWPQSPARRERRRDVCLESAVKIRPVSALGCERTAGVSLFPFLCRQLKLCTSGRIYPETLINQQETPYAVALSPSLLGDPGGLHELCPLEEALS